MKKRAIGIFDSGVGGLAIAKVISENFPHEDFIYVADLLNCPYGPKNPEQIRKYVEDITDYLVKQDVKAIVIACNTASVEGDNLGLEVPIIKMIEPTIAETIENNINNNVLLLATQRTIDSKVYEQPLLDAGINLYQKAMPEFVTLVESLEIETEKSYSEVDKLLEEFKGKDIGTVILGCTHFGFLGKEIKKAFPKANLVSGANMVSKVLRQELNDNLKTKGDGTFKLLTTDDLKGLKNKADYFKIKYDVIEKIKL